MIDKAYCMSSYLAFRYIERSETDFFEGMHHKVIPPIPEEERITVGSAQEIHDAMESLFNGLKNEKKGLLLSGGMDSANLASYMSGAEAYTFRFQNNYQSEELRRAEFYARRYQLRLHYVDIAWDAVESCLPFIMEQKGAPVHSIEPQIYLAAVQAKKDGVTMMITGASADLVFGGMDQLLAKDWSFRDFTKRYTFTDPASVLQDPVDISYVYERYREQDTIDFLSFLKEVSLEECASSYWNAFACADMPYIDPYFRLMMKQPLDLKRVRSGKSKYLIRELFHMRYPDIPIPDKIPMPRPVDQYFKDWKGPKRKEFRSDLDLNEFTGNQKWQIYCLERFLDRYDRR